MTLAPILAASPAIQAHIATVFIAILTTLFILFRAKGTRAHRIAGWVWVAAMMSTAVITFWINESGSSWGVSWIHIFSIIVLTNVPYAIYRIRKGDVLSHKTTMLSVAAGSLGVAGAFAFLPGRRMFEVFLG